MQATPPRDRRAPRHQALAAAVVVIATLVVLGSALVSTAGGTQATAGTKTILIQASDRLGPLGAAIERLEASGFSATSDTSTALQAASRADSAALLVTRATFKDVPAETWAELYERGVIVGGLDVSLHELQPLARPGTKAGWGRLAYTPERPIFSFMFSLGGCGFGAMSDWIREWDLGGLIQWRAAEVAASPARGTSNAGCPLDQKVATP